MRIMTAVLSFMAALLVTAGPIAAQKMGDAAQGTHYGLSGVVTKIQAGILFIKTPYGLRPRSISPNKADRVGLHNAKIGDPVLMLLDSGNVLLDAGTPTRTDLFEHRLLAGRMDYSDPYWSEFGCLRPWDRSDSRSIRWRPANYRCFGRASR